MAITGGGVSFEQSRKLAEYENRKVVVTFSVTDETDATALTLKALDIAKTAVFSALGLIASAAPPAGVQVEAPAKPAKPAKAKKEEAKPDPALIANEAPKAEAPADPLDFLNEAPKVAEAEPLAPVSDKELTDATTRKNAELQAALTAAGKDAAISGSIIRECKQPYAPFPQKLSDIPAEKRHAFLEALKALKA